MTMQMPCLKNADTQRLKQLGLWLGACVLSHAQLGFAADLMATDTAFEIMQKQAQQWAANHPSFQGKQVQVVPVDPRITVQSCQQTMQFEQPFPNQPAIRVRCAQPAWQLFVNLNTGQATAQPNRANPTVPVLHKVLVSKELLKRGTVITPAMFS
jgi:flagella basal body P-ring formation protein FlgA